LDYSLRPDLVDGTSYYVVDGLVADRMLVAGRSKILFQTVLMSEQRELE